MTSPDWAALARQVADSVDVRAGSRVSVTLTGIAGADVVSLFVDEVYRRGAQAQVVWADAAFDHSALAFAADDALSTPSPLELAALAWSDVHVAFRPLVPPAADPGSPERAAALRAAKGIVSSGRWNQRRWAVVRTPTDAWATMAGIDPEVLREEFFAGTVTDWDELRARWEPLPERLAGTRIVRIQSDDTDLSMSVAGRSWVLFAGEANLPDGEIATAPVDDSVTGHITFPGRFWFADNRIEDLVLSFEAGRVVDVSAARGADFARALIASDAGAARVGELGVGLNARMRTLTGDLFLDEKVLGTVHIALGRAYPECGGTNRSAVHWDIVKDLRANAPGGAGDLTCDDLSLITRGEVSELLRGGPNPLPANPNDEGAA